MRGIVPIVQDGAPLVGAENVEAADRLLRVRDRSRQQPDETRRQRLHRGAIEQVGGVFEIARYPRRRAVGAALLGKADGQVELGAGRGHRFECRRQPRQLEADLGIVLQHQHHLEQRMPRQRARRVDHLDQPLERQLLVAVGREVAAAHAREQFAEARIA